MSDPLRPVSMTGQSAWQDLLRLLKDSEAANLRGSPKKKTVRGLDVWFDQYRIGEKVVERYIGEDSEELRARMEAVQRTREAEKLRERERSRLMRILQAEGFLRPDLATGQMLMAMARSGVFRLGGTVVGTQAFRHYEGLLGVHLSLDDAAVTQDIDIASFERLSVALRKSGDQVDPALGATFSELDFVEVPSTDRAKVWRWRQTRQQTLVEFLTPSFEAEEGVRDLPALGVSAQSFHFLNYLIAEPVDVPLLYRTGAIIRVPRPERFAIHKLIVAERRREGVDSVKSRKDRAQAALLIAHLSSEQPHVLADAYEEAYTRGPAWRSTIDASLRRLAPGKAAIEAALAEAGAG